MTEPATPPVLVMDLDGTVIRSDTTHELLILCMRWAPLMFPFILVQLIFDRARAKRRLAEEFVHAMQHVVGPQEEIATVCIGPNDDMERRRKDIADAIRTVDQGQGARVDGLAEDVDRARER